MASFSVAVTRKFGDKEETDWFNVECWGALAEGAVKHCLSGREVFVEGRMQFDKWTDKEGKSRMSHKIVVRNFQVTNWRDGKGTAAVEDDLDIPMAG